MTEPTTEAGRDFLYDYQAFGPPSVRQFTDGILAIEAEAYAMGYQRREMFRRELTNGLEAEIANDVATQSTEGLTNREPWRPPRAQNIIG